jgi:hypothetical protein
MTQADKVYLIWQLDKKKNLDANIASAISVWNNSKDLKDEVPWTLYLHPEDEDIYIENDVDDYDISIKGFHNRFELDLILDKKLKRNTIKIESA